MKSMLRGCRPLSAMLLASLGMGVMSTAAAANTGSVTVATTAVSVDRDAGTVSVKVVRSGGSSGVATASFGTHSGTAKSGTDYDGQTGRLTWQSGDTSAKSITITLTNHAFTGSKAFTVAVASAQGAALGSPATTTVTILGATAATSAASGPAAKLAVKLGKPTRLLVGLGAQGSADPISTILSQGDKIDIYERYLGSGDWTSWNSPPCDYVCVVADAADSVGAVPMFTQYQMANNGDGNLASITNAAFMQTYWARVKLLFQDIAAYGKPALVNLEPDFWGYVERAAPNSDPTKMTALVSSNADCASLPNTVTGVAECLISMARKYAPKAYVGFPPSNWGGNTTADVVAFMNAVGAQKADFIVEQTLDRDAGCMEVSPQPSYCVRSGSGWYWDETNDTHPNFQDHLTEAEAYHSGIGNLPLIWWQTPEGVPSTTRGGSPYHYRDNRMNYFLTHPAELVAVGGLGVVFSTGEGHQTNISTDGGQFQALDAAYLKATAALP